MYIACLEEANQTLAAITHSQIQIITDIEFIILPLIQQNRRYSSNSNQCKTITNFLSPSLGLIAACTRGIPLLEYVWSCRLQKELLCLRFFKRGRDLQSVTVSCWSLSWLKPFEGWTNSFGKGPENDTQHKCQTSCLMFTCTMQM